MNPEFSHWIGSETVDFGKTSDDYLIHRPGFPESFYNRLETACRFHYNAKEWSFKGKRVLDLGTGPGVVALVVAQRGATVVGIDIAANQIQQAQARAKHLGLTDRCVFAVGRAEELKQESNSFDMVIAAQCWWWFEQEKAMNEIRRVLKPGGLIVLAQYCYLPRSPVAHDSDRLLLHHNPKYTFMVTDGLFTPQVAQLEKGGFPLVEMFSYDHIQPFSHVGWRGRMRTCHAVGGSLSAKEVDEFDAALKKMLSELYPKEPVGILHRVFVTIARFPPSQTNKIIAKL